MKNARVRPTPALPALAAALALAAGCSSSGGGGGGGGGGVVPVPQPPGAFVIQNADDLIGGDASDGRPGDILMRNERIQVVISSNTDEVGAPRAKNGGGGAGVTEYAGNLIDADLVRPDPTTERDLLHGVAPMLNIESTTAPLEVAVVNGEPTPEAPMVVQVTAVDAPFHALDGSSLRSVVPTLEDTVLGIPIPYPGTLNNRNLPVDVVTTYTLPLDSNTVEIVTTIRNTSAQEFQLPVGAFFSAAPPLTLFITRFGFGSQVGYTALSPFVAYAPSDASVGVSYGYVIEPFDFTGEGSNRTSSSVATPAGAMIVHDEDIRILIGARAAPIADFPLRRIPASGEISFRRFFVVADGAIEPIARVRDQTVNGRTGTIEGIVQSPDGSLSGARVAILFDNPLQDLKEFSFGNNVIQGYPFDPGRLTFTDAEGRFEFQVPAGIYNIASSAADYPYEQGRIKPEQPNATRVSVVAGFTEEVAIVHPQPGLMQVDVVDELGDPMPGRVTIVGMDGSPDPIVDNGEIRLQIPPLIPIWEAGYFEDITDDHPQYGVARTLFVGPDGTTGAFPIDPGLYQVCVSRGPAYNLWCSDEVGVLRGTSVTAVRAVLTRVVDTAGLLSVDTSQRGAASTDGRSSLVERIAANVAEDVQVFVGADRGIVTDYTPGFEASPTEVLELLAWAPGVRAATFDYGHYTAFPMRRPADRAEATALAPDWTVVDDAAPPPVAAQYPSDGAFVASPRQLFAKIRAGFEGPAGGIIQLDRINDPAAGQFAQLDVDARAVPPRARIAAQNRRINPAEPLFSTDFDAIEIWNGGGNAAIDRLLLENAGDWFHLLNQGIRKTATGNASGRGRTAEPPGSPRNYVLLDAAPITLDCSAGCPDLVEAIRAGRSFVTNGPIVRASVGGTTYGGTAAAPGGNATLRVEVASPAWAEFDRIRVYRDVRPPAVTTFLGRYSVECTPTGALRNPTSAAYPIVPVQAPGGGDIDPVTAVRSVANGDLEVVEEIVDPSIPGASRWTASVDIPLTGLGSNSWVVVFVDGTCGESAPIFPVAPGSVSRIENPDLGALIARSPDENGVRALAFTNPIYFTVP